ncbi:hypothetical protein CIG75_00860 [Tumebacillus algifaecis]|uniref:Hydroxyacid dehydrogenase n=1 Tax=Tumebacillus algifaecis TaxID=1214604 RepID=A0A223CWQ8_9BACL|nr:NAD(P)-dependent oxidoreductase [Tumebacillus algifaecis]ASS73665.1 hypothetical protein CIG75_00860 [Tumebacillus algifaecis]
MNVLLLGTFDDTFQQMIARDHQVQILAKRDDDKTLGMIGQAEMVVIRSPHRITDEMIRAAAHLRWIIRGGSGTDNISSLYREKNIALICVPANARSVAELSLGMMLSLYRQLRQAHRSLQEGKWLKNELSGFEVQGKKLGIIGFGNIGQTLGQMAHLLGMHVNVSDRSMYKADKARLLEAINAVAMDSESLLSDSDIVVLCTPLTSETHHMICRETLALMKTTAILINIGRGGLVNTDDLYQHLVQKKIAGAGLDVFETEPPSHHPIFDLENVICTPHIGAQTRDAKKRIGDRMIEIVMEIVSNRRCS